MQKLNIVKEYFSLWVAGIFLGGKKYLEIAYTRTR
jgi:hypothetical protein